MDEECDAPCEAVEGCTCTCVKKREHQGQHSSREQHLWGQEHVADRTRGGGMRQAASATPPAETVGPPDVGQAFGPRRHFSLIDPVLGQRLANQAIAQVGENANEAWKQTARGVLHWLCQTRPIFTVDDIWIVLESDFPEVATHEGRAMGWITRKAEEAGWCRNTNVPGKSVRPGRHSAIVFTYESLLYQGPSAATG